MRQLRHAELDLHMTAVGDPLSIFHRFPGIREQSLHFLFALHIILAADITHPILVRQLFRRLDAQEDIVGFFIFRISIMNVVGNYQRNIQLLAHFKKSGIYRFLLRDPMVLHFQKIIAFAETRLIF